MGDMFNKIWGFCGIFWCWVWFGVILLVSFIFKDGCYKNEYVLLFIWIVWWVILLNDCNLVRFLLVVNFFFGLGWRRFVRSLVIEFDNLGVEVLS